MATSKKGTTKKTTTKRATVKSTPRKAKLSENDKKVVWLAVTVIVVYLIYLALTNMLG